MPVLQAAKKATRAAQYKVDASYDEPQYKTLVDCGCDVLESQLRQEIGSPDSMQYPGAGMTCDYFSVPHDSYDEVMARKAYNIAKQMVDNCTQFLRK